VGEAFRCRTTHTDQSIQRVVVIAAITFAGVIYAG
jgi:hypothetical protein